MLASIDTARVVRGVLADTRSSPGSTTSFSSARAPQAFIQGHHPSIHRRGAHRERRPPSYVAHADDARDGPRARYRGEVLDRARPYHDFAGAVDGQIVQRLLRA